MQVVLELRKTKNGLAYGIPIWYRILSFSITIIIIASAFVVGQLSTLGIILAIISFLTSIYEETWYFNTQKNQCISKNGTIILARTTKINFDDISRLSFDVFAKGKMDQKNLPPANKMPYGSQLRLIIETKDGKSYLLDSVSWKQRQKLSDKAKTIATFLSVPLEE